MYTEKQFEEKYSLYDKMVYKICLSYLENASDAEDIFQDSFLEFYNTKKTFDSTEYEKYFLIRLTINNCKDFLRKKKKQITIYNNDLVNSFKNITVEQDAGLKLIYLLPEKQRELIVLRYINGLSSKEIAVIFGKSDASIRKCLERCRQTLKNILEEKNDIGRQIRETTGT